MKKIVINPYTGFSDKLSNAIIKFGGDPQKPECSDGLCPIPGPLKLMTKKKINSLIDEHKNVKSNQIKEIIIVSLNNKDQLALVKMSRTEGWGAINGLNIKIVCEVN